MTAADESGMSDANTSRVDDSFIFQQVHAGDSGPGFPLSSTAPPAAIPGLDSLFQEGVDYRKQKSYHNPSATVESASAEVDEDSADSDMDLDTDTEAAQSGVGLSPKSAAGQNGKGQGHLEVTRRPLSLPLPPTTGDEEMEEEDEGEGKRSESRSGPVVPPAKSSLGEMGSPVVPVIATGSGSEINPSLTEMVSSAVKQLTAPDRLTTTHSSAPPRVEEPSREGAGSNPREPKQAATRSSEVLDEEEEDEELLECKRRDLNARIEALMQAEQDGTESEEEVEEAEKVPEASPPPQRAVGPAETTKVAEFFSNRSSGTQQQQQQRDDEEEEPLIDDDELHDLLGV
ncbi:hypothetical protein EGW08_022201 [Elysia chlorotica]|uniref:Uncharacterized protein n=1 Tax=Elysia chlorotica TaxID=188477 RepID=A0A433SLK0_ELYCH|nr:hypothetical protein EGW08_022201 [Elysia chlorotica]